jgi:hypothetical protein
MAGISNPGTGNRVSQSVYRRPSQFTSRIFRPWYDFPLHTPVTGTISSTIGPIVSTASGTFTAAGGSATGTISATLAAFLSTIIALLSFIGTSSSTLGTITSNAVGNFFNLVFGTISSTISAIVAFGVGIFSGDPPPEFNETLTINQAVILFGQTDSSIIRIGNKDHKGVFVQNFNNSGNLKLQVSINSTFWVDLLTYSPEGVVTDKTIEISGTPSDAFLVIFQPHILRKCKFLRFVSSAPITASGCKITLV